MNDEKRKLRRDDIDSLSFTELRIKYREAERQESQKGHLGSMPNAWVLPISRKEIDDENPGSLCYLMPGGTYGAFYYCDDGAKFTVFAVTMNSMDAFPITAEGQFSTVEDCRKVIFEFLLERLTPDFIRRAHEKGKGYNAAEIILYRRNQARSTDLHAYREKMRKRQMPLKPLAQWEFFADMIERGHLVTEQLRELLALSLSFDEAAGKPMDDGRADKFDAAAFHVGTARARFLNVTPDIE